MPENPPAKEDLKPKDERPCEEPEKTPDKSSWSEDQKTRSYYYDDASGYEVYDADAEDEDDN
jgi:hypothetical protein